MRVTVIVNRHGGTVAKGGDTIVARIAEAFRVRGIDADVQPVAPQDLAAALARTADEATDGIVAVGGDGTISCAANAGVAADLPLGIVPLGTLNHFARDAGLPLDIEGAVAAIASGSERRVDVGELNGRIFVNNSSIGLYPTIVRERDLQQRRWHRASRSLAMLVASVRALRKFSHKCLRVGVANREAPIETRC
jgi:diacylglycerol kinase family enzyme